MEIKIKKKQTPEQDKAKRLMGKIAKYRGMLEKEKIIRPLKNGEHTKQIFSEYIEWYICKILGLKRPKNRLQEHYDGIYQKNIRDKKIKFQIKEVTRSAPTVKPKAKFHYLVAVALDN